MSQPPAYGPASIAHIQAGYKFLSICIQGCFLLNALLGAATFLYRAENLLPLLGCGLGSILSLYGAYLAYYSQCHFARAESMELVSRDNHQHNRVGVDFLLTEILGFYESGNKKVKDSFSACALSLALFAFALITV